MPDSTNPQAKEPQAATLTTSELGVLGEELAADFLMKNGYRLVLSNFRVPVGRNRINVVVTGEIDLIGYDDETLCFIEIKTRSSDDFASPAAAVNLRKQRQIVRTSKKYRRIFHLQDAKFRYDVVSIVVRNEQVPEIELFKNFFSENQFRKNFWTE